jgi:hypothetical protein
MSANRKPSLFSELVRKAVEAELERRTAQEARQWSRCFGSGAPKSRKKQVDRIIRVASARALMTGVIAGGDKPVFCSFGYKDDHRG